MVMLVLRLVLRFGASLVILSSPRQEHSLLAKRKKGIWRSLFPRLRLKNVELRGQY